MAAGIGSDMIYFDSDYMAGAHPKVMERLLETNSEQTTGYGTDAYTANAVKLIRQACGIPDARVHLLVGGTQTNATVIDGILAHHEGVLAAESGHINVHESGAIEATRHKILIDGLKPYASFEMWGPRGETESTVRFVTGWSTTDEDIDKLESAIASLL